MVREKDFQKLSFFAVLFSTDVGEKAKIAIVVDNAPWHNVPTPESVSPNRSWRKKDIQDWLEDRGVDFDDHLLKAELLEQALANAPPKEYNVRSIFSIYRCKKFVLFS
jgi:hypothetical protein